MRKVFSGAVVCVWLAALAAIVFTVVRYWGSVGLGLLNGETLGVDDANIYLRYARNVGGLNGIVWNIGGERVEGMSSLLWLLLCVGAFLSSHHPEHVLYTLNLALVSFALWASIITIAFVATARDGTPPSLKSSVPEFIGVSSIATVVILWWFSNSPAFVLWTILSLLDTGLWCALVTVFACALSCYAVSGWAAFRCAAYLELLLLPACRPDGAPFAIVGCVALVCAEYGLRGAFPNWPRKVGVAVGLCAASVVGLTTARWLYFGYPLPNTYYAKVDSDVWFNMRQGWEYVSRFALMYPCTTGCALVLMAATVVFALWSLVVRLKARAPMKAHVFGYWGLFLSLGIFLSVWVGGDHFTWWRFLQPYLPLVVVGSLLLIDGVVPARITPLRRALVASPLLILIGALQSPPTGHRWQDFAEAPGLRLQFEIAVDGRAVGSTLNEIFAQYATYPSVGALAVGGLGYTYKGPVNDLLALNNVEMAHASTNRKTFVKNHAAFDSAVFLRQRPTYLFLVTDYCELSAPKRLLEVIGFYADAMKHVHESTQFKELYVPIVVWNEQLARNGWGICGYALREELASGRATFGHKVL